MQTIDNYNFSGKKVIVRVDFNVPLDKTTYEVTDDTRIRGALPTIKKILGDGGSAVLMSHLGRPKGKIEPKLRLDPVARRFEDLTGKKVKKFDQIYSREIKDYIDKEMNFGDVVMLENLRFDPGEKENNDELAKSLASLAEIYVNDAFGAAHRAHASVVGVTKYLPSVAGLLMKKENEVLSSLLESPARPFIAILGGSKVSSKIPVIRSLLDKVNSLILGGGMTYTFLKAQNYEVGKSLCEEGQIEFAREMMELAKENNVNFLLPIDVVVAKEFDNDADKKMVSIESIPVDWMGLDIGEKSIELFTKEISSAGTIFWNGPMGVFEWENFSNGTRSIARAVAESQAVTVAGGGDTITALNKYKLYSKISHVSSGGGAAMEFLEGKELPGVVSLMDK